MTLVVLFSFIFFLYDQSLHFTRSTTGKHILPDQRRANLLVYIHKTQSLSVCMSAIEIKLETFRYKQTYEFYITFSREAKYGILISIRIVYGGLRAYIYSTYIKILELSKVFVRYHKQKKFVTNKNPNLMVMSKTVLSGITSRFTRR